MRTCCDRSHVLCQCQLLYNPGTPHRRVPEATVALVCVCPFPNDWEDLSEIASQDKDTSTSESTVGIVFNVLHCAVNEVQVLLA